MRKKVEARINRKLALLKGAVAGYDFSSLDDQSLRTHMHAIASTIQRDYQEARLQPKTALLCYAFREATAELQRRARFDPSSELVKLVAEDMWNDGVESWEHDGDAAFGWAFDMAQAHGNQEAQALLDGINDGGEAFARAWEVYRSRRQASRRQANDPYTQQPTQQQPIGDEYGLYDTQQQIQQPAQPGAQDAAATARSHLQQLEQELTQIEQELDDHHTSRSFDAYGEAFERYKAIEDQLDSALNSLSGAPKKDKKDDKKEAARFKQAANGIGSLKPGDIIDYGDRYTGYQPAVVLELHPDNPEFGTIRFLPGARDPEGTDEDIAGEVEEDADLSGIEPMSRQEYEEQFQSLGLDEEEYGFIEDYTHPKEGRRKQARWVMFEEPDGNFRSSLEAEGLVGQAGEVVQEPSAAEGGVVRLRDGEEVEFESHEVRDVEDQSWGYAGDYGRGRGPKSRESRRKYAWNEIRTQGYDDGFNREPMDPEHQQNPKYKDGYDEGVRDRETPPRSDQDHASGRYATYRKRALDELQNAQPPQPEDPEREQYDNLYARAAEEIGQEPDVDQNALEQAVLKAHATPTQDDEEALEHVKFYLGKQDTMAALKFAGLPGSLRCPACGGKTARLENPHYFECRLGHLSELNIKQALHLDEDGNMVPDEGEEEWADQFEEAPRLKEDDAVLASDDIDIYDGRTIPAGALGYVLEDINDTSPGYYVVDFQIPGQNFAEEVAVHEDRLMKQSRRNTDPKVSRRKVASSAAFELEIEGADRVMAASALLDVRTVETSSMNGQPLFVSITKSEPPSTGMLEKTGPEVLYGTVEGSGAGDDLLDDLGEAIDKFMREMGYNAYAGATYHADDMNGGPNPKA